MKIILNLLIKHILGASKSCGKNVFKKRRMGRASLSSSKKSSETLMVKVMLTSLAHSVESYSGSSLVMQSQSSMTRVRGELLPKPRKQQLTSKASRLDPQAHFISTQKNSSPKQISPATKSMSSCML